MKVKSSQNENLAFTLIEIMVVVAVIGILAVAVFGGIGESSTSSRDAKRQSDLRNLQGAIESYKVENGRYPEGCNGPTQWSGQVGTDFECSDGTGQYIVDLAPEYIPVLPVDPRLPSGETDVGYVYVTNSDGSVYKIMAMNTVEAEELNTLQAYAHPLRSCAVAGRTDASGQIDAYTGAYSICNSVYNGVSFVNQPQCRHTSDRFAHSYGLWGGFSNQDTGSGVTMPLDTPERQSLRYTSEIICK